MDTILTNYALSQSFQERLRSILASEVQRMTVSELRQLPLREMVKKLRQVRADRLLLPVEDENAGVVLPILKLLAGMTRARRIEIVRPDLSRDRVSRASMPASVTQLVLASLLGRRAVAAATVRAGALLDEPRSDLPRRESGVVMYLNANLWFGVRAGGSVGHIAGVINGLLGRGHEVDLYSAGGRLMVDEAASYHRLIPPTHFGLPWEANYYRFHHRLCDQLAGTLDAGRYRFIYQRMSVANFTGVELSRRLGIPLVLEYNGSEAWIAKNWGRPLRYQELAERVEEVNLRHAHIVVTVSDVLRDELIERGVDSDRIVTYPNCVDPTLFDPGRFSQEENDRLRARYGIAPTDVVVTFLGTFGQWHGTEVLARAISLLVDEDRDFLAKHGVRFLLVGDGLKMPEVRRILGDHADGEFVVLAGLVPQDDAAPHLAASDVLCSPHVPNEDGSRFFGSPTKLFEYMAMGRAIIASDLDQIGVVLANSVSAERLPDVDAVREQGSLAMLVRPGDPSDLAAGLKRLVLDRTLRDALGENARSAALRDYTWERHVQEILTTAESQDVL